MIGRVRPVMRLVLPVLLGAAVPAHLAMPALAAEQAVPELQPADRVRQEAARRVPPLWRVEAVTVDEDAAPGPGRWTGRVSARLRLARPTFVVEAREGPVSFIRQVGDVSVVKMLTGTAAATRDADGWSVSLDFDNAEVLDSVGSPAAELPGRTVVIGSDEAKALRAERAEEEKRRAEEEKARLAATEERLAREAAADRALADRVAAERRLVEARAERIEELRALLTGTDRARKIAAYEAALGGDDTALRQLAIEAALESRDPVLANLALKDWFGRRKAIPVLTFATKEEPGSVLVQQNLGPLTLTVDSFNTVSGAIAGTMGAPGYSITHPSAAIGSLAQTELAVNSYGCSLVVRLSGHRTMDGLFRCQTLPALIARITVD